MANRWETMEAVTDFIFLGSKVTAHGDSSHEIKRHLFLGRKFMTNLDIILKKQRHYFTNKGLSSQSYGFSSSHMWMWELYHKESWALKNWCFWIVVLEKTLESPLDWRRSNQSILKEINPNILWKDWWWSWNSNTLVTWWEELSHWKRPWCWERLTVGREGDSRGWDGWMTSQTRWTWVWASSWSWWWTGRPGALQSMGSQRVRHNWATELN